MVPPSRLALITAVSACQPFYRDDLRAGRRAEDTRAIDRVLAAAERALATGDLARGATLARAAIRIDPKYSARGYVVLATALRRSGDEAAARAVIAYGERSFGTEMRTAIVATYTSDDRIADALDYRASAPARSPAASAASACGPIATSRLPSGVR